MKKTDQNDNKCKICCYQSLLVIGALFMIAVNIVLWVLMYTWFGKSGCSLNLTLISLTIVAVVALNVVSIAVKHGSIFVTALVCLYGTYLCYAGIQSKGDPSCNAFPGNRNTLSLWIGVIITAVTSAYTGYSVAHQVMKESDPKEKKEEKEKQEEEEGVAINVKDNTEGDTNANADANTNGHVNGHMNGHMNGNVNGNADSNADGNADGNADAKNVQKSNYDDLESDEGQKELKQKTSTEISDDAERRHNIIFHICMAFASVYIAMLYTNWATDSAVSSTQNGREIVSLAVNISGEWLSFVLYLWTLLAPVMCSQREFS